jgi:hypothetical protein
MKHTLIFDVRHPKYTHTMILRRLGPDRWEVESFTREGCYRQTHTRAGAIFAARINRETMRVSTGK